MKKVLNNRFFLVIVTALICTSVTVLGANFLAKDIKYTPADTSWGVDNVEAAINSLQLSKTSDNYSTEERVVGTWIDGKPIYQIVLTNITFPSLIKNDSVSTIVTNSALFKSISVLISVDFLINDTNVYKPDRCGLTADHNGLNVTILGANTGFGGTQKLILRYTKTTDTASNN